MGWSSGGRLSLKRASGSDRIGLIHRAWTGGGRCASAARAARRPQSAFVVLGRVVAVSAVHCFCVRDDAHDFAVLFEAVCFSCLAVVFESLAFVQHAQPAWFTLEEFGGVVSHIANFHNAVADSIGIELELVGSVFVA